jgi:RHS repeat-associated protein
MLPNLETLLCRYHYDPLDRLVDCTPTAQATTRRFYLKDHLATEIQGAAQRSIMQHGDQLLAQRQRQSDATQTQLLATDQQRSVLNVLDVTRPNPLAYSPYGHRPAQSGLLSLLGFNGERPDPVTGCYLLGNGYRAFNPVLMRFNSPDGWSPFGEGGLNAYAYCVGDPVNRMDKTGHVSALGWKWIQQNIKHVAGKGPKVSTLGRLPVLPSPTQKPTARTAVTQDESVRVIASQQRTIESMQKTIDSQQKTITSQQRMITSQQKNIDSAQQSIQVGRTIVSDYQGMLFQQGELMADLREDLAFSVHLNGSLPTGIHTRTLADVDAAYGQHSLPSQSRSIQPNNSAPQRNAAIRNT